MGEYYNWVNVDRKEYLCPCNFGYGNKAHESVHWSNKFLNALRALLSSEWKGCRIVWLGDECPSPEAGVNEAFDLLRKHSYEIHEPENIPDVIFDTYRNVSALFTDAEKDVRPEIAAYLKELQIGNANAVNEYGISPDHPYDGLFERKGAYFRYTVNYTKKVCYSREETEILFSDGEEHDYADPLPLLAGYGRILKTGPWAGDVIGVADEIDDTIRLLSQIRADW